MSSFTRMSFLGQVSFNGALWGLVEQWQINPYRWRVLAVSILLTAGVLYGFIPATQKAPPKPFDVVYISTFEDGRTDEQIVESNAANQEVQDGYREIEQERLRIRREFAEAVGRATGVDVDKMKAEAAREEAAAQRDIERRRAEIMARAEAAKKARNGAVGE
jgi:hypothetical protein